MKRSASDLTYSEPPPTGRPRKRLVVVEGPAPGFGFTFFDRIEIGRTRAGAGSPGLLQVNDPTVSSAHCVITQEPDGRCYLIDTSRNGTRVDGRRLSPNLRSELAVGQVLAIGRGLSLRLEGDGARRPTAATDVPVETLGAANTTLATILVGDIRDYTGLVQRSDPAALQDSVSRLFARLEQEVVRLGGTVKEFQGDALFAFWERDATARHAADACRAALALERLVAELATDPAVWRLNGHPLRMDWGVATGPVTISGHGANNSVGLSMVGRPVVLAFRIEKYADDATGRVVVCPDTRGLAGGGFAFRELGARQPKGFDDAVELYALVGEAPVAAASSTSG